MNPTATTYRPSPRRIPVIGFVLCAVLAILFWDAGAPSWNTWITRSVSVICSLVALMLVFYKEICVDPTGRVVREITLLFGFLRVWRRDRGFNEFHAVRCYVSSESEGGLKTWAVALVPAAGYPLDLGYFSDPTASLHADEFARELGQTIGLEVRHETA